MRHFLLLVVFSTIIAACSKEEDLPSILFNPSVTYGSMTDQNGNKYKTVIIGNKEWMAENLRTTIYRNGDPIPNVPDSSAWRKLYTGAYCFYNNKREYIEVYGFLYNHYAVTDKRNLAPEGWHVASYSDWSALIAGLGGDESAGNKLKETGTAHWLYNNNATNESGFTALPGGYRFLWQIISGRGMEYGSVGSDGNWWASDGTVWIYSDFARSYMLDGFENKDYGLSVRCVKD